MEKIKEPSMTIGIIWKEMLTFFFPLFLGNVLQQIYNVVDTIIVGKFVGAEALSAVGGPDSAILFLYIFFFVGISSGATVVVAKYYGAQDGKKVSNAVHSSIMLGIIIGPALAVIGWLTAEPFLRILNTPDEIMDMSLDYLNIYLVGFIFANMGNMAAGIMRGVGDSKRPFYYLLVSTIINIVLDVVFVCFFKWGVAGAAWATNIAQFVSAALAMRALMVTDGPHRFSIKACKLHRNETIEILRIGLPNAIRSTMFSISNVLVQAAINSFSTLYIAGAAIEAKVDGIFFMINESFGNTLITFIGQNYGAQKKERIIKGIRWSLLFCCSTAIIVSVLALLFVRPIAWAFTDEAQVVEIVRLTFWVIMPPLIICAFMEVLSGTMTGLEHSIEPTIATLVGACFVRVAWAYLVVPSVVAAKSVKWVLLMVSWPAGWVAVVILDFIFYLRVKKKEGI
ncbi:MAG: MATE family efflux transporter [Clostridia bacterium]|nr:MATE family efflux transporter [Clostridia bacterium]